MDAIEYALRRAEPPEGGPRWEAWEVVVEELRRVGAISEKIAYNLQTGQE
jgi:hypothetical protein